MIKQTSETIEGFTSTERLAEGEFIEGYSITLGVQDRKMVPDDVYEIYNDGFQGKEYVAPDAMPLFGVHNWASSTRTYNNSFNLKLTQTALKAALKIGLDFVDACGHPFPQTFDTIIVKTGGEADRRIKQINNKKINTIRTDRIESETAWFLQTTDCNAIYCENNRLGIVNPPFMMFGSTGTK